MAVAVLTKAAAASKATAGAKAPSGGYQRLVSEAVEALKETQGSSMQAISKYVSTQHPDIPGDKLRIQLRLAVKRMVEKELLRKIKASYKLTRAVTKAPAVVKRKAPIKKKPLSTKKVAAKPTPSRKAAKTGVAKKSAAKKTDTAIKKNGAETKKTAALKSSVKVKSGTMPRKVIAKKKGPGAALKVTGPKATAKKA
jgi:linker histone H1 and H5 family